MGRPRTVSDDTILAAARDVFLEHGPAASTTCIAKRVGLSQAALFKRFGTKQDLMFRALAPPEQPPFFAMLEGGPDPDRPLRDQLDEVARVVARFFRDMVPCLMVLRSSDMDLHELFGSFDVPPPIRAQVLVAAYFERAMEQGQMRRGDPFALTFSFLGAFYMRAFLSHLSQLPYPDDVVDAHVDSVMDALWFGLAPETP